MEANPRYLDEKQAAQLLNVTVRTLQGWRWLRRGPPVAKFGRCVRYPTDLLEKWITDHLVMPEVSHAA